MTLQEWLADAKTDRQKYLWRVGVIYDGILLGVPVAISVALMFCLSDEFASQSVLEKFLIFSAVFSLGVVLSPIVGFLLGLASMKVLFLYLKRHPGAHGKAIFRHLQIGSACFVALSHGLNDAQKSMGLITLGLFAGGFLTSTAIPIWVIMACAIVMGLGTAMGGFRIIKTMGFSITKIDPVQGFAAEASASAVILTASFMGMPVSSTHMIAGSITGVGYAKGSHAVYWQGPRKMVLAWVFTLPGAGAAGALAYWAAALFGVS